jgi:5'-deoxynucleotidase YfbR-like HD superfamily hydrolase
MTPITAQNLLAPYKEVLGKNFVAYSNHVHRVVQLTMALKHTIKKSDEEKIIIAAVFHDIGIWTRKTFDYLDPSIAESRTFLQKIKKTEWEAEIFQIIRMHHKISTYSGDYHDNVEAFRKADLVDLSKGLKSFGVSKNIIKNNYLKFPSNGFQKILFLLFLKQIFISPMNPLPMLKK